MAIDNGKITEIMDETEQERIASCYTRTTDHYGELPYSCKDCEDFEVCYMLDTQNIVSKDKGGE